MKNSTTKNGTTGTFNITYHPDIFKKDEKIWQEIEKELNISSTYLVDYNYKDSNKNFIEFCYNNNIDIQLDLDEDDLNENNE